MQRNSSKRNAYYAGRSAAGQELIYQHMSNHYRRILNAKKVVDTSPPYCYKQKRPLSGHVVPGLSTARSCKARNPSPAATDRSISTNSYSATTGAYPSSRYHMGCFEELSNPTRKYVIDKHLIEPSGGRQGAPSYCEDNWTGVKAVESRSKVSAQPTRCRCNANLEKNAKRPFETRETESLRKGVYSIQGEKKTSPEVPIDCAAESPPCKCWKMCVCESKKVSLSPGKDQLQTSSRDSAYNGGVSSLPESRSPTPDRRIKKEACACSAADDRLFQSKDQHAVGKPKSTEKPDDAICGKLHTDIQGEKSNPTDLEKLKGDDSLRKMKEDDLYTKFIEDITVEILEKCLYTNKALKKVMKKHILTNLQTLDKNRMLKEVDFLRLRLGIPEDHSLFDLDLTTTNSNGDIRSVCSVISDSEFVMPDVPFSPRRRVMGESERTRGSFLTADREQNLIKTVSSDLKNEGEFVSVVHMNKENKDGKKSENFDSKSPDSFEFEKYSSDDESEESFGGLKRSKIEKDVKKHLDMIQEVNRQDHSDSESSSEIEENISEENLPEPEDNDQRQDLNEPKRHKDESATGREFSVSSADYKRNRTVSFWSLNNFEEHETSQRRDNDDKPQFQDKKPELQK